MVEPWGAPLHLCAGQGEPRAPRRSAAGRRLPRDPHAHGAARPRRRGPCAPLPPDRPGDLRRPRDARAVRGREPRFPRGARLQGAIRGAERGGHPDRQAHARDRRAGRRLLGRRGGAPLPRSRLRDLGPFGPRRPGPLHRLGRPVLLVARSVLGRRPGRAARARAGTCTPPRSPLPARSRARDPGRRCVRLARRGASGPETRPLCRQAGSLLRVPGGERPRATLSGTPSRARAALGAASGCRSSPRYDVGQRSHVLRRFLGPRRGAKGRINDPEGGGERS